MAPLNSQLLSTAAAGFEEGALTLSYKTTSSLWSYIIGITRDCNNPVNLPSGNLIVCEPNQQDRPLYSFFQIHIQFAKKKNPQ